MRAQKEVPCLKLLAAVLAGLGMVSGTLGQDALIIDHTCTDLDLIPPEWIDAAKALTFHYAHTSHGSQVVSGAENLEAYNPFYSIAVRVSGSEGLPPAEYPPALRMYDGNPPGTYINPEDYWDSASGRDRTRAVAATGHYDYSMWSWCGQVSWMDATYMQTYLGVMSQFETEFPAMRFILMTGHTDGSRETGNLHIRNNQIRSYALSHGLVLFDFADIESWDPSGVYYLPLGCNDNGDYDGGNWCAQWCAAHPGSPLCDDCGCAHSQPLICNLKGRAFWWMMARLAGWPGPNPPTTGDLNCDGLINTFDIDPFVLALSSPEEYATAFPGCDRMRADVNGDGEVNTFDIDPFVLCLTGGAK